ncbi:hypothetical protein PC116_g24330 [Phytophthora cactorum]|nr:hypothetical protein PC114_g21579 [Phytophthora cactorum]KAG2996891.1 hypothetical protein PC120_g21384 [Phytophthora cactorum]KAG4042655.1 hypothetical protein PC123_g21864 [Phytophthora cactorum]KAG4227277.1 hypothetical protein PC116_g24330 [Phytophthora cactorum]
MERSHVCAERARDKEEARQARYYDRQRRTFEAGDTVWVYNPPRGPKATSASGNAGTTTSLQNETKRSGRYECKGRRESQVGGAPAAKTAQQSRPIRP